MGDTDPQTFLYLEKCFIIARSFSAATVFHTMLFLLILGYRNRSPQRLRDRFRQAHQRNFFIGMKGESRSICTGKLTLIELSSKAKKSQIMSRKGNLKTNSSSKYFAIATGNCCWTLYEK